MPAYIADISYFSKEMKVLVWVDETGCDKQDMLRKFGYAFEEKDQFVTDDLFMVEDFQPIL